MPLTTNKEQAEYLQQDSLTKQKQCNRQARERRASETPEQRQARLEYLRKWRARKKANATAETVENHRRHAREYMRQRRKSTQTRAKLLAYQREYAKTSYPRNRKKILARERKRREAETPEQRHKRLEKLRIQYANQTPQQRQERRLANRIAAKRYKLKHADEVAEKSSVLNNPSKSEYRRRYYLANRDKIAARNKLNRQKRQLKSKLEKEQAENGPTTQSNNE